MSVYAGCPFTYARGGQMAKMLYADAEGLILEHPSLHLAGASGTEFVVPEASELIALPEGSKLFFLPGTRAVGWDPATGRFSGADSRSRKSRSAGLAVAALLSPGHTSNLLPAFESARGRPILPLWAYTAVGFEDGRFVTSAVQVDDNPLWRPDSFDDRGLEERVRQRLAAHPGNRLLRHLAHCAVEYHCFAAKNLFLQRGEIPLPSAPACNADCVGCISLQPAGCCPSPQERIAFAPEPEEITEIVVEHFAAVDDGIASFGQGCEGEPLTQSSVLSASVRQIRRSGQAGTLNLNTNGYSLAKIREVAQSGLDSIRFSLNSVHPGRYGAYFRPRGYAFSDVIDSIDEARRLGLYISLNLLVFPGVSDRAEEVDLLLDFLEAHQVDLIQLRNLNIDPDLYGTQVGCAGGERVGIRGLMEAANERFPELEFGYFNRPKSRFAARGCA